MVRRGEPGNDPGEAAADADERGEIRVAAQKAGQNLPSGGEDQDEQLQEETAYHNGRRP